MSSSELVLKLDFNSAFNSVQRDRMLLCAQEFSQIVFLSSFLLLHHLLYFFGMRQTTSHLKEYKRRSFGPLLFCLIIHHLSLKLKSQLCLLYLDDVTLEGEAEDVLHDLGVLKQDGEELGLTLPGIAFCLLCKMFTLSLSPKHTSCLPYC